MNTFCTNLSADYLPYGLALYESISRFDRGVSLVIFLTQGDLDDNQHEAINANKSITILTSQQLDSYSPVSSAIKKKYYENFHSPYRWSMKPILINYLLDHGYEKVIYVDCDIYFFNDYMFLFHQLNTCNVLLSPHWRSSDPYIDPINFQWNYLGGIYNGGFVGASQGAQNALKYWADCCLYKCEVNTREGFFADQKYLDILASRFKGVDSIRHKGCNVANWNLVDCKRSLDQEGNMVVDGEYDIVFIHFTRSLFDGVLSGTDELLLPFLEEYSNAVRSNGGIDNLEKIKQELEQIRQENANVNKERRKTIREKLQLGTRLKRLFE